MADNAGSRVKRAINELASYNKRTRGKTVGNVYLGSRLFVATLNNRRTIEGQWEDRADIVDMMDEYTRKDIGTDQKKKKSGRW